MKSTNYTNINKKPEVLSPAGNKEAFYAVLRAGADAVYLAGNKYGARAYAENFTEEELCECIRYAHLYGRRVYMTVNTLMTDNELSMLEEFLTPMYEAGLDGVIVQDLGAIKLIGKLFPGLELHASTQLNITGTEGAEYVKELGVCRVVPARELSLEEIKKIKRETGLELECFIHGAMCYSYSGQCLFSSCIGGRSGNRGRCAQPCRLPYKYEGNNTEVYPLSLKDMCSIDLLPELIEAGIDSYKIEGRMKKPEFAAGATYLYRKYVDKYLTTGKLEISNEDRKLLTSLYIRSEISSGYYKKYNGSEMVTLKSPSYNGADEKALQEIRTDFIGDNALKKLPKFKINMSAGFTLSEPAYISASYEDIYVIKYGDVVLEAQNRPLSKEDIEKQIKKLGSTEFVLENDSLSDNIYLDNNIYYNLKGINELRREVIKDLEDEIIRKYGLIPSRNKNNFNNNQEDCCEINEFDNKSPDINRINISVLSYSQLYDVVKYLDKIKCESDSNYKDAIDKINIIYIPEELLYVNSENPDFYDKLKLLNSQNISIYIAGPYVRRNKDLNIKNTIISYINKNRELIKGFLARNIEDLYWLDLINKDEKLTNIYINPLKVHSDFGIYSWNKEAMNVIDDSYIESIGLPIELNGAAHRDLLKEYPDYLRAEKMVYGRIPLMHSANCVKKTINKCNKNVQNKNKDWIDIKDRTGRNIPVYTDCLHCQNTLYNAIPLVIVKELQKYSKNVDFRIEFTNENGSQIENILSIYLLNKGPIDFEFTKGFERHSTE